MWKGFWWSFFIWCIPGKNAFELLNSLVKKRSIFFSLMSLNGLSWDSFFKFTMHPLLNSYFIEAFLIIARIKKNATVRWGWWLGFTSKFKIWFSQWLFWPDMFTTKYSLNVFFWTFGQCYIVQVYKVFT